MQANVIVMIETETVSLILIVKVMSWQIIEILKGIGSYIETETGIVVLWTMTGIDLTENADLEMIGLSHIETKKTIPRPEEGDLIGHPMTESLTDQPMKDRPCLEEKEDLTQRSECPCQLLH